MTGKFTKSWHRAQHTAVARALFLANEASFFLSDRQYPRVRKEVVQDLFERFSALVERDWNGAVQGDYPRELILRVPLAKYFPRVPEWIRDLPRVAKRKRERRFVDLPADLDLESYPRYYTRNFHCQTDGWLSARSARLWDLQADLFFLGAVPLMQRSVISELVRALKGKRRPCILDLGCGTGSLLAQVHRAIPEAELFALDLSPYYLREARENLRQVPAVSFLLENAEKIRISEERFDAVISIGLFHELPMSVRATVLAEARRVLTPGGSLVVSDALQFEDRSPAEYFLKRLYTLFHEPFLQDYMDHDFQGELRRQGLEIEGIVPNFLLKTFVARKSQNACRTE